MTRKTNEYICIIKVQKVCYKIHLVNMCINVVRVIIELIVQYYNILDGTQYMFIPLSLDESLVQQNLKKKNSLYSNTYKYCDKKH